MLLPITFQLLRCCESSGRYVNTCLERCQEHRQELPMLSFHIGLAGRPVRRTPRSLPPLNCKGLPAKGRRDHQSNQPYYKTWGEDVKGRIRKLENIMSIDGKRLEIRDWRRKNLATRRLKSPVSCLFFTFPVDPPRPV